MKKLLFITLLVPVFLIGAGSLYAQDEACDFEFGTFEELDAMPWKQVWSNTCVIDGKIYVTGGNYRNYDVDGNIAYCDTLYEYDPVTGKWNNSRTPMPVVRNGSPGSCVVDGKWYIPGGMVWWFNDPVNDEDPAWSVYSRLDVYDPKTDTWEQKQKMPVSSGIHGVAAVNDKVYVIGGESESSTYELYNTLFMYDPVTDKWTPKANLPKPRTDPATVVYKDKIYCFGGRSTSGIINNSDVYDPATDTWTSLSPMPEKSLNHYACLVDDVVYIFGGFPYTLSTLTNHIWKYYIEFDKWQFVGEMPIPMQGHRAEIVGQTIYLIGGGNLFDGTNDFFAYTLGKVNLDIPLPDTVIEDKEVVINLKEHFSHIDGDDITFTICNSDESVVDAFLSSATSPLGASILTLSGIAAGSAKISVLAESSSDQMGNDFKVEVAVGSSHKFVSAKQVLQLFPNPATEQVIIRYVMRSGGEVQLKIFDVLGKQIDQIVDFKQASGSYEYLYHTSQLTPGVYFCELSTSTNKMVVRFVVE